jgi:hypothetical protein
LGEREREREREKFPGSMHEGLLATTTFEVHPTVGGTGTLEARGGLHSWAIETVKEVQRSDFV